MGKVILMIATITVLAGCATTGDFCDTAKPIRPAQATIDVMTDAEVEDALAHNTYGASACGWRP